MHSIFEYNDLQIPNCSFRISPSSIDKFFSYPSIWYKENILNQNEFTASTSTVLGTVVHAVAEAYAKGITLTREDIDSYIDEMTKKQPLTESSIQAELIKTSYPDMAMTLVNSYIKGKKPTETEVPIYAKVLEDIYVGGTVDNRTGDTIVDYKTYNSTTKPSSIPFGYKIQTLAYAWAYKQNGVEINRIRLVYVNRPIDTRSISEKTGKPIGKITPPEVTVLSEIITPEDWELIENTLKLIAETILAARKHPELVHLLFKSYKLKEQSNGRN